MWPALIAISANRPFAIVDFEGQALEYPRDTTKLADFIAALSANGVAFEARLLRMLGRADLSPRPMAEFPGFPPDIGRREAAQPGIASVVVVGDERADTGNLKFAVHAGGRHPEYVAATGEEWLFKTAVAVQALGRETGQSAIEPAKLVPPMLTRFMATDRAFARARKQAVSPKSP